MLPIVHVYTVCWNEEKMLPFFLRHYASIAERIVVYDNQSTDRSPAMVRACPKAELREWDTGGTLDDEKQRDLFCTVYRESRGKADFVFAVNMDEFLVHPCLADALDAYRRSGVTIPRTRGYNMASLRFPSGPLQIYDYVKTGSPSRMYSKFCVFHPDIDINFLCGNHECRPRGVVKHSEDAEVRLLHYHYVGFMRNLARHARIRKRLSAFNRQSQEIGMQYKKGALDLLMRFVYYLGTSVNVFTGRRTVFARLAGPLLARVRRTAEEF